MPSMYDGSGRPLPLMRKRNCASTVRVAKMKRAMMDFLFIVISDFG